MRLSMAILAQAHRESVAWFGAHARIVGTADVRALYRRLSATGAAGVPTYPRTISRGPELPPVLPVRLAIDLAREHLERRFVF